MKNKTLYWLIGIAGLLGLISMSKEVRETVSAGVTELLGKWATHPTAMKWANTFRSAELKYGIPGNLLKRMAYQESHWRDDIISGLKKSGAGAVGMMQLVPKWHPNVNPLDTAAAIDYAGKFLSGLYKQFGSWKLAVAAYNAGAGNVSKYKGIPPFTETQNYVKQVFADLETDQNRSQYA